MKKCNRAATLLLIVMGTAVMQGCAPTAAQTGQLESAAVIEQPDAAAEARMTYYQGQIVALSARVEEMDAAMYRLSEEYHAEKTRLEQELQQQRQANLALREQLCGKEGAAHSNVQTQTVNEAEVGYTYRESDDGIVITAYHGKARDVVVPAAIDGKRVVGLDDSAFAGRDVVSVKVPETVRSMGWFVFYDCSDLDSVLLPASVESIGYACFDGCSRELTLTVTPNSYAEKYAASFALHYVVTEPSS